MLDTSELIQIEESLKVIFNDELLHILINLNRTEKLEDFLDTIGYGDIYPSYKKKQFNSKKGKIVILAGTKIKELHLIKAAESLGISRDRLELCLEYDRLEKYDYKKMQHNSNYSLVIFGQSPHSGYEKGKFGSIISAISNTEGYPPVIEVGCNGPKISISNFKDAITKALEDRLIEADINY